jgi:hypothetical protein
LARRSLKPQLNQIRTWVRQGRTDAWIAHQLEVSVGDIRSFKREHELVPDEGGGNGEEGYGLWLDPAIQDDPVYAEHWAGHRPVTVTVEPERIVISRAGEEPDDDDSTSSD